MTQTVAIIALAVFAVGMIFIGLYSVKHTRTLDGFLLGGRKIGAWMSAFAYGTSYFSAVIFIGYAGKYGWDIGLGAVWIGIGNAVLGCLLAWGVLAKRTRRMTHTMGSRTMPEFFEGRYGDRRMKTFSAIVIFVFLVPYAASVYKGLGSLFGVIFPNLSDYFWGLDANTVCMIFVAVLTAVYLFLGGYLATTISDFVQGIIMIVGVVVMVFAITNNPAVGGIQAGLARLAEIKPSLTSAFGGDSWNFLATNILLTSFGVWGLPQMVQKFYAIRDERSIRQATVVSTVFALVIGVGAYFTAVFARFFVEATASGAPVGGFDQVVPTMLMKALGDNLFGNILLAVILLLLLSASMSTLSAIVLTSSSAISVDLMAEIRPKFGGKRQMVLTRVLCLLFVGLSLWFASANFTIIASIMAYSWGAVSGCFLGPYLWGLYSKKITRAGAWSGMLGGLGTIVVLTLAAMFTSPALSEGLYAAFQQASANSALYGICAMAVSAVLPPVVSKFTKPLDQKVVDAAFSQVAVK